jgi:hypothetical protein
LFRVSATSNEHAPPTWLAERVDYSTERSGGLRRFSVPMRAIRSIFSICNALSKEVFRHYPMFRHRSATPACVVGNGEVRSLGNNVTSILRAAVGARADTATASITAVGGQQSGSGQPRQAIPSRFLGPESARLTQSSRPDQGSWPPLSHHYFVDHAPTIDSVNTTGPATTPFLDAGQRKVGRFSRCYPRPIQVL